MSKEYYAWREVDQQRERDRNQSIAELRNEQKARKAQDDFRQRERLEQQYTRQRFEEYDREEESHKEFVKKDNKIKWDEFIKSIFDMPHTASEELGPDIDYKNAIILKDTVSDLAGLSKYLIPHGKNLIIIDFNDVNKNYSDSYLIVNDQRHAVTQLIKNHYFEVVSYHKNIICNINNINKTDDYSKFYNNFGCHRHQFIISKHCNLAVVNEEFINWLNLKDIRVDKIDEDFAISYYLGKAQESYASYIRLLNDLPIEQKGEYIVRGQKSCEELAKIYKKLTTHKKLVNELHQQTYEKSEIDLDWDKFSLLENLGVRIKYDQVENRHKKLSNETIDSFLKFMITIIDLEHRDSDYTIFNQIKIFDPILVDNPEYTPYEPPPSSLCGCINASNCVIL